MIRNTWSRFIMIAVLAGAILPLAGVQAQDNAEARAKARKLRAEAAYQELKGNSQQAVTLYEKSLVEFDDPMLRAKVVELKAKQSVAAPAAVEAAEGGAAAESAVSLAEVVSRLDLDGSMLVYLNTENAIQALRKQVGSLIDLIGSGSEPEAAQTADKARQIEAALADFGLFSVRALAFSLTPIENSMYRTKAYISRSDSDMSKPMWKLAGSSARRMESLDYLPAETAFAWLTDSDLKAAWQFARDQIGKIGGEEAAKAIDAQLQALRDGQNIDVEKLIGSLGEELFISLQLSSSQTVSLPLGDQPLEFPAPSLLVGIRVSDDTIQSTLLAQATNALPMIMTQEGDTTLYSFTVPEGAPFPLQPTLATYKQMLFIGSTPQVIQSAIQAAGSGGGLREDADFKKLFAAMPENINGLTYFSPRCSEVVNKLQDEALAGKMGEGQEGEMMQKFMQEFNTMGYGGVFRVNEADGMMIEGTMSYGGQNPVALMLMAPVGMIAAIAIPSFVKAKEASQEASCINNLRMIDAAKEQWALENEKAEGDLPTEEDIAVYLPMGMPVCSDGGVYSINAMGENPTCTVPGHELVVMFEEEIIEEEPASAEEEKDDEAEKVEE